MPTFRVIVSGANLLMEVEGNRGRYGFEVARFVDADDASEAGDRALGLVRESPQWRLGALNAAGDPPRCWVSEVTRLPSHQTAPSKQPGFAFFPAEPEH